MKTKYQLKRDGILYEKVYNRKWEAKLAGDILLDAGWIKEYEIVPIIANWLVVK
jgi:hypothetical protein